MKYSLWIYFGGDYSSVRDEIENFVQEHFPGVKTEGSGTGGYGSNDISFGPFSEEKKAQDIIDRIEKNKKLMRKINSLDILSNEEDFSYGKRKT